MDNQSIKEDIKKTRLEIKLLQVKLKSLLESSRDDEKKEQIKDKMEKLRKAKSDKKVKCENCQQQLNSEEEQQS